MDTNNDSDDEFLIRSIEIEDDDGTSLLNYYSDNVKIKTKTKKLSLKKRLIRCFCFCKCGDTYTLD